MADNYKGKYPGEGRNMVPIRATSHEKLKKIQGHKADESQYSRWSLTSTVEWMIDMIHDKIFTDKK